jgi:hypothetical protein
LGLLLRVAFTRWNVGHALRVSKSELGFRHFEGRSYVGLLRHLTLCCVTLTVVAGQAAGVEGAGQGEDPGGQIGRQLPQLHGWLPSHDGLCQEHHPHSESQPSSTQPRSGNRPR